MLDAVAERGYHPVTVGDLVGRAKISRRTFYELFPSKEACFAASFEMVEEVVRARLTDAIRTAGQLDWRQLVHTSLAAYLDILAEEPRAARALHVEALFAGPALAGYRARMVAVFADRMRAARNLAVTQGELHGELPDYIYDFLIGGIDDRIRVTLQNGAAETLPELAPMLSRAAIRLLSDPNTEPAE